MMNFYAKYHYDEIINFIEQEESVQLFEYQKKIVNAILNEENIIACRGCGTTMIIKCMIKYCYRYLVDHVDTETLRTTPWKQPFLNLKAQINEYVDYLFIIQTRIDKKIIIKHKNTCYVPVWDVINTNLLDINRLKKLRMIHPLIFKTEYCVSLEDWDKMYGYESQM